jgi:biotin operon repressor
VEPPEGTTAHLLWEYYNIFDMATENGALNFDVVEDAQQEMYSRLTEQEFDWLMDNIRVAETNLNPTIQKMKNAGRYVSSVQVSVQGVPIKYWDIDKHPMVVTALVSQGFNRRRVEEYVNASHLTRGDLSRSGGEVAKFSAIEQALYKLKDEGQLVNQLKNEFYSTVPSEWIETMVVWGYTFTGDDDARDAMHSWLKTTGNSLPDRPYKEMASQALKDAA